MKQAYALSPLEQTVFYWMDKAIKTYRQFAHSNIRQNEIDITIDQWLVLKTVVDHPDMKQTEIASMVFKDHASVTRIIELLVKRGYLTRSFNNSDRRRFKLELTQSGKKTYDALVPIVAFNRSTALDGISPSDIEIFRKVLFQITNNCAIKN